MKYLKLFEELTNYSKNRKWPAYTQGKYPNSDLYFVYDLSKADRGKYLNTWFDGSQFKNKQGQIFTDEVVTLKKTDKETSRNLYHREFNPVTFRIMCPTGAKFTQNEKGEDLYNMIGRIHSIDDSSYGIWWNLKPLNELKNIRTHMMSWVNNHTELNGEEFLNECISQGANAESKDYD